MLCQNLAGACAKQGVEVLLIDIDPQAHLSSNCFGQAAVDSLRPHQTTASLFDGQRDPGLSELIHPTKVDNIFIVPSSDHLKPFDLPLPFNHGELQFVLRDFVEEVREKFDIIWFDTPPNSANLLAWSALMASDYAVAPVPPEKNPCEAVKKIKAEIQTAIRNGNSKLVDLGYIVNNSDTRTAYHRLMERELRQLHGPQVFDTVVYRRTELQVVEQSLLPISHEQPSSREAAMIDSLLHEIIERIQSHRDREQEMMAAYQPDRGAERVQGE